MPAYENTSVPVAQSKASIDVLLEKYHVADVRWTTSASTSTFAVEFNYPVKRTFERAEQVKNERGRTVWRDKYRIDQVVGIRIAIPWPADEREQRRRARVLYWHLKSKLEAVDAGVVSFIEEFLPHVHIGGGRTVYEALAPAVERRAKDSGGDLSLAFAGALTDAKAIGAGS